VALEWPLLRLGAENVRRVLQLGERTPGGSQAADREQIEWVIGAFAEAYDDPVILFLPSVDYEKDPSERGDVESAVRDSAQRHGLRFVDVRSQMAAAFTDDRMPSHGFANTVIPSEGHLNETGHQIVARALADVLATKVTR
jgi:lysophospholipase L1-like esterase